MNDLIKGILFAAMMLSTLGLGYHIRCLAEKRQEEEDPAGEEHLQAVEPRKEFHNN